MAVLKSLVLASALMSLSACQISYVTNNAWEQTRLYNKRTPIEQILADSKTKPEVRKKLALVQEAKAFAMSDLGLKKSDNYSTFVELGRPYVTWIVHASPSYQLESYRWWFPIIGHVPYKGFFSEKEAQVEAQSFDKKKFDTYVRGVTAYSTLGWFEDPVFSSMLGYSDHDLVNTIIHESVHATVFAKSQADFNERMATFLGDWGVELFYSLKEGPQSPTVALILKERMDQHLFADFLKKEMKQLREWYLSLKGQEPEQEKAQRLNEIQRRFREEVSPKLQTKSFSNFGEIPLNNARLMALGTYYEDLNDFELLRKKLGPDFKVVLAFLKNLSAEKRPESALNSFVQESH